MEAQRSVELLLRQRDAIDSLASAGRSSPAFKKWQRDTEIAIQRIFGESSRHKSDFTSVRYTLGAFSTGTPEHDFHSAFIRGLETAKAVLDSMVDEIREYDLSDDISGIPDQLSLIEKLCLRFNAVARQLQSRYNNRTTVTIEDEYDVQDLMHAMLQIHFDDIRREEWTPSYAGGSSRVDFLLKKEEIVLEVKKTRPTLRSKERGEQLIIDRARYEVHPDCKTLVCFVYDPDGRVGNPVGIERDLEQHTGSLKMRVIIAPRA